MVPAPIVTVIEVDVFAVIAAGVPADIVTDVALPIFVPVITNEVPSQPLAALKFVIAKWCGSSFMPVIVASTVAGLTKVVDEAWVVSVVGIVRLATPFIT